MKLTIGFLVFSTILLAQPGWKTVKDKTGACQFSVPPSWTLLATPGHVAAPDHHEEVVIAGLRPFKPYNEPTLKMMAIKLYENSAKRVFYVSKPSDDKPPLVTYHVEVPGSTNRCVAQFMVSAAYSEEEAKKIALSLSPVR